MPGLPPQKREAGVGTAGRAAALLDCSAPTAAMATLGAQRRWQRGRRRHLLMGASAPFGLVKWITVPLSLKRLTSSMAGMLFTPSLFSVFCNRLSSVVVVLWMAFFFRRTEPLPPVRTWEAIFASFSGFMAASSGGPHEQSARVAWHVRVGQRVCSSQCVEDGRSLGGLSVRFSHRLKAACVVARGAGRATCARQTTSPSRRAPKIH